MVFTNHFVTDLQSRLKVQQGGGIVVSGDNLNPEITVELYNGSEAATPSGSVVGAVIRPDGATVPITGGTISSNAVTIALTAACFTVLGQISVGIQLVSGDVKTTVLLARYNVDRITTDNVIDPSGEITLDVADLIADIDAAVATIPQDYTQLQRTVSQQNEQMLDNFGRILSKTRIMTVYEIGRYIANGFSYASKYARNSIALPAGTYIIHAYTIQSRACLYVSDTSGTWITSAWSNNVYTVVATGAWYLNFASTDDLTDTDIAAIESNFVIERVNTGTLEERYCVPASAPLLKNVLVPDFEEITYNGCAVSKQWNTVKIKRVETPAAAFLVELSGAAKAFFAAAPSNSDYTPTLANLLPVALANPLKISVRNVPDNYASTRYICIQWVTVSGDTITKLTPTTKIDLADAEDTIRISTFDIPTGATHFVILIYVTRSTAFAADGTDITIDFESRQIAALLPSPVSLTMGGGE